MRGIAVVDVGYTNSKVVLFSPELTVLAERRVASAHRRGAHYDEIDIEPLLAFVAEALPELDAILPIDRIVTSAHGACIACIDEAGELVMPLMDYASEPPHEIVEAYRAGMPSFAETYAPLMAGGLLHAMQLFWMQRIDPVAFARTKQILPLIQLISMRLGGRAVTEISSMSCQTHLKNLNTHKPSSLALREGWAAKFAPEAKAWEVIGTLNDRYRGNGFRGRGEIAAGAHDSNANLVRYLSAGLDHFTLLSTGTWIIGIDGDADISSLDGARDLLAGVNVFGKSIAVCRFWGGKEYELITGGAAGDGTLADAAAGVARGAMALPAFTDLGGPLPGFGGKGHIVGDVTGSQIHALASLYCALMTDQCLSAIQSKSDVIVDGPFSQNAVYLAALAALRKGQRVLASRLRDGTVAGAACLGLMNDATPPRIAIEMDQVAPLITSGFEEYVARWRSSLNSGNASHINLTKET
jgi:sugar (pentulose or hexulose) kinase